MANLTAGADIYYTGDMANPNGFGRIVEVRGADHLVVVLDAQPSEHGPEYGIEERRFVVPSAAFAPGPGRRFWLRSEWLQDRAQRIAAMTGETMDVVLARMSTPT